MTDFVNKNGSEKYSYSQAEAGAAIAAPDVAGDVAKRASSTTRCALSRHLPHWVEHPVLRLTSWTDVAPAQTCSRMARSVTPLQMQMYILLP